MKPPTDDNLIESYRAGRMGGFEQLFERYAARLVGFVISLGASAEEAEDTAQKTWLRTLDRLDDYEGCGRFRAWLFTLAYREFIDTRRSAWERRKQPMAEEPDDERPSPGKDPRQQAQDNERRRLLEDALAQLSEPLRQTILLRVDGELSYAQIAEEMGCPLGTVQWRLKEARGRLKEIVNRPSARGELKEEPA